MFYAAGNVYRQCIYNIHLNMHGQTTLISKKTFGGIFFGLIYVLFMQIQSIL